MLKTTKALRSANIEGWEQSGVGWGTDPPESTFCSLAPFGLPFGFLMRKYFEKGKSLPVSHRKALCLCANSPGKILLLGQGLGGRTYLRCWGQMAFGKATQLYH